MRKKDTGTMIHLVATCLILQYFDFYDTTRYGKQANKKKHIAQEEKGSSTILGHLFPTTVCHLASLSHSWLKQNLRTWVIIKHIKLLFPPTWTWEFMSSARFEDQMTVLYYNVSNWENSSTGFSPWNTMSKAEKIKLEVKQTWSSLY